MAENNNMEILENKISELEKDKKSANKRADDAVKAKEEAIKQKDAEIEAMQKQNQVLEGDVKAAEKRADEAEQELVNAMSLETEDEDLRTTQKWVKYGSKNYKLVAPSFKLSRALKLKGTTVLQKGTKITYELIKDNDKVINALIENKFLIPVK